MKTYYFVSSFSFELSVDMLDYMDDILALSKQGQYTSEATLYILWFTDTCLFQKV